MSARLTAYLPEGAAEQFLLRLPGPLAVGRETNCALVLRHPSVSRRHAEFVHEGGRWRLRDLGSKNGSFVEGAGVAETPLAARTWLRFGDVPCEFEPLDADGLARAEHGEARRRSVSRVLTQRAAAAPDLPDLLAAALSAVVEMAGCERGFLLLSGPSGLAVQAWQGLAPEGLAAPAFAGSASLVARAMREGRAIVVNDARADPQLGARASVLSGGLRAMVCLPLRLDDELLGVAYADSRQSGSVVTRLDLELLEAFAGNAALWIAARRSELALATRAAPPWPGAGQPS